MSSPRKLPRFHFLPAAGLLTLALLGLGLAQEEKLPPSVVTSLKGHSEAVYAVTYTADGQYLVTGSFDRTVKVFETTGGKEFKSYGGPQGHQNLVLAVALSPDNTLIASGGSDNTAKIWDFPSGKAIRSLAHAAEMQGVALSPDGKVLAGAGKDGVVRLWNPTDGKELFTLKGHEGPVLGVSFSGNN